ncbi:MAG: hypothetical protein Kow00100_03160 [Geothermobacteraceae bacterium]
MPARTEPVEVCPGELERYRLLVEAANDVFYQLDQVGCWTYLNRAWEEVTGFAVVSSLGTPFLESVYPTDLGKARQLLDSVLTGSASCERTDLRLKTSTGSYRWVELVARPFGRIGQGISGITGTMRDVTARRLAEEALRENEERYRRIFSNIQDIYFESSMGGLVIEVSPSIENSLGYRRDQLIGMPFSMLCDDPEAVGHIRERLLECERLRDFELLLRRRGGETVPCSVNGTLVRDENGKPLKIVGSIRDVSERKRAEDEIRSLAYHDQLTGLPNRSLLKDRMQQALAQARRQNRQMAVLFLDLDRFKDVNDTLGHDAGDELLRMVAEKLDSCVRQSDTVARLGGDEFVILLTSVKNAHDPVVVAEKILQLLTRPFVLNGKEVFTSTSIGIAMYPNDGADADTLLKHADMAMYEAKEHGRSHFQFFSEKMHQDAFDRNLLEHKLRVALEEGQFELYYQPQWDMRGRRLIGVEALVRWFHPEDGPISPARFIPVAEDTGLIRPLGEWVLRTACAQLRAWQDAGLPPIRVGVNISGRQFRQPDLVEMIDRILAETGLDPRQLELELTETYLMEDAAATSRTLEYLKVRGLELAIDDFGTGYSSLSYLKHFPIDRIKIDQSFVREVVSNADDAAIVEAIIAMANSLELDVIAEGVETARQLRFLKDRGCSEMQGYFFARPMPADEMGAYLHEHRDRLHLPERGLEDAPDDPTAEVLFGSAIH